MRGPSTCRRQPRSCAASTASRRARSWPSSTATSSARPRPSARWRSRCATASAGSGSPPDVAAEVTPKNILMIGPTGVGKTEIARRLARLSGSPFVKVEASKFTEVGYVGPRRRVHGPRPGRAAVRHGPPREAGGGARAREHNVRGAAAGPAAPAAPPGLARRQRRKPRAGARRRRLRSTTREKLRGSCARARSTRAPWRWRCRSAAFAVLPDPQLAGRRGDGRQPQGHAPRPLRARRAARACRCPRRASPARRRRKATPRGPEQVARAGRSSGVQDSGIVFIDEIDKIAGREGGHGPDVSREGVQRDILPIVEGTTVSTKYGPVRTDHILFIAAGAFHVSKPSGPHPGAAGALPDPGGAGAAQPRETCVRILTGAARARSLTQYQALLATEGVELSFTSDAVHELARLRDGGQPGDREHRRPAAAPRCWRRCSTRSPSRARAMGPRAVRIDARRGAEEALAPRAEPGSQPVHSFEFPLAARHRLARRLRRPSSGSPACGKRGSPAAAVARAPDHRRPQAGPARRAASR